GVFGKLLALAEAEDHRLEAVVVVQRAAQDAFVRWLDFLRQIDEQRIFFHDHQPPSSARSQAATSLLKLSCQPVSPRSCSTLEKRPVTAASSASLITRSAMWKRTLFSLKMCWRSRGMY